MFQYEQKYGGIQLKGVIKKIMYDRNYGFVNVEGEEEEDVFFHRTGVKEDFNALKEGDEVEFEIEETDRGKQAIEIVKA